MAPWKNAAGRGWRELRFLSSVLILFLAAFPTFLASCGGEPNWPEGLPHGEVTLTNIEDPDAPGAYFDISAGELIYGDEGRERGDVYLERTFVAGNPALGIELHDAQPDSILYDTTAPGWGSSGWKTAPDANTPPRVPVRKDHNIWVKTSEGNIGKVHILLLEANSDYSNIYNIKLQWIYQPDGSGELHAVSGATGESGTSGSG